VASARRVLTVGSVKRFFEYGRTMSTERESRVAIALGVLLILFMAWRFLS
jgi:hypothetical protein